MKMRFGKRKAHYLEGHMGVSKEVIMKVLFRFNGQAAYQVDTGRLKKIRVVFGMIDEKRTSMAWYLFSSDGDAKSKRELANDPMPPEQFGYRQLGGRDPPRTFKKKIRLDELAINPKGTTATLELDTIESRSFIECRIDKLTTKAKEVVTFPFGLQKWISDPSRTRKIDGTVRFLGIVPFNAAQFILGPRGKAELFIFGPAS